MLRGDVHPPLRLLWLNVSTIAFGINDFALRLPGLLGLAILVAYIVRRLSPQLGLPSAWALAFAIDTMPLLWHAGTIAESSIWGALAFSALALLPIFDHTSGDLDASNAKSFDFLPLYMVVAFASLSREAAFVAGVPLIVVHTYLTLRPLAQIYRKRKQSQEQISLLRTELMPALAHMWSMAYPLIIIVPLTLFTAYTGTPTTDHSGLSLSYKLVAAVGSGAAFDYLKSDFGWPWWVIMVAGLLPWRRRNVLVAMHFVFVFLLFYSINPYIWGAARYQLEIGVAATVSGIIELSFLIKRRMWWLGKGFTALLVLAAATLIVFNIQAFKRIHTVNGIVDNVRFFPRSREGSIPMLSEISYAFDDALSDIKRRGLSKGLYVDGTVYWVGGQILVGYDLEEISTNYRLPPLPDAVPVEAIDRNLEVNSALYVDRGEAHKQAAVRYLTERGWTLAATYPHYGLKDNVIYLLVREHSGPGGISGKGEAIQ